MQTATMILVRARILVLASIVLLLVREARGQEPTPLPPDLLPSFGEVMFTDMSHGYALGKGVRVAILATDDGGGSWRVLLDVPGGESRALGSTFFLDANHFWVFVGTDGGGSTLYRTSDGGRTLETSTPKFVLPRIGEEASVIGTLWFRSELEGWCSFESDLLLKTTDAGATWNSVTAPGSTVSVRGVAFFSDTKGVGWDDDGVSLTDDGGKSWSRAIGAPGLWKVSCTREGLCAGLGSPNGPAFVSHDRGQTWQDMQAPLMPGRRDRTMDIQAFGSNAVAISGSDLGFNVKQDLDLYVTGRTAAPAARGLILKWDGSTWTRFTHASPTEIVASHFIGASDGWLAAGRYGLFKTTDGGQTLTFVPDYFRQLVALTPSPTVVATPTPQS